MRRVCSNSTVLALLVLAGCSGADKEENVRLKAELESAQAEIKQLRDQLAARKTPVTAEQRTVVKTQLGTLTKALQAFKLATGEYPNALQELTQPSEGSPALVEARALVDPWGRPYQYDPSGPHSKGKQPDVWTVEPGGAAPATIGNWMLP